MIFNAFKGAFTQATTVYANAISLQIAWVIQIKNILNSQKGCRPRTEKLKYLKNALRLSQVTAHVNVPSL